MVGNITEIGASRWTDEGMGRAARLFGGGERLNGVRLEL